MHTLLRPLPLPDFLRRGFAAFTRARGVGLAFAVLALGFLAAPARAQIAPIEDLDKFPLGQLEITDGKKAKHVFEVWLADSSSRQAQGLMFVRSLAPTRGMLFVHQEPRVLSMWMKNTYIPLDMVFIDDHSRIVTIVENTTPHSLSTVSSGKPALAVLEIGGGEAKRLGLHAGQRVTHPALLGH